MPKIYDENGIATEIDDSIYYSLEDLPGEEWKDIFYFDEKKGEVIDYRGVYQISSKGRVKSLLRYDRYGRIRQERILKPCFGNTVILKLNKSEHAMSTLKVASIMYQDLHQHNHYKVRKDTIDVICTTTGTIYKSISEAARQLNIDPSWIIWCCKGKNITKKYPDGHHYRRMCRNDSVYEFYYLKDWEDVNNEK